MSKKNIVLFSDSHGCLKTLLALIEQAKKKWGDFDLYSCGDEIDRGPDSRGVVEYLIKNKIPSVMANHTDLCLDYSRHREMGYKGKCSSYYSNDVWLYNGGIQALKSWGMHDGSGVLPRNVLDWMQSLPPYIIPDAEPDENGRRLLVSHTGFGLDADKNTKEHWYRALWARYSYDCTVFNPDGKGGEKDDGLYRVFGHTPHKQAVITDTYARIDCGAAYGGSLCAFHWPSKQHISIKNID